eukprot:42173-Eustigmatos_ZCMA.PRE.1
MVEKYHRKGANSSHEVEAACLDMELYTAATLSPPAPADSTTTRVRTTKRAVVSAQAFLPFSFQHANVECAVSGLCV